MKILLTGGRGMVGRNLLDHSQIRNFEILAPSRSELDLTNINAVRAYFELNNPDMVIHSAGKVGGIQANIREPISFFLQNLNIGQNLLLVARECGVKRLLNLASSCMYPKDHPSKLKEEDILTGLLEPSNEGYALAKISITKLCSYINNEDSSFKYKTVIPCNLYGKYDKFDPVKSHLIPAIIYKINKAINDNQSIVTIWGDGTSRREFMYAGDLSDSLIHCVRNFDEMPELLNIGLGYDYSIREFYETAADVLGFNGEFDFDLTKPVGMKRKLLDVTKLSSFGWNSKTELREGILNTYKYFLSTIHK